MEKIKKLENGEFTFDYDRYFTLPEAIRGQLHEEGDLSNEAIVSLVEHCYGKREDNPTFTDEQWRKYMDYWIDSVKNYSPEKKCICERVLEEGPTISIGDECGQYVGLSLSTDIDSFTKKRCYYIEATGEDSCSIEIRYCPVCGRRLW